MPRTKSTAKNSVTAQIKAHQDVKAELEWPTVVAKPSDATQREIAEAFFVAGSHERSKDTWSTWQIQQLASLAVMQSLLEVNMRQLDLEGTIVMGGKSGTTSVQNPLVGICQNLRCLINQTAPKIGLVMSNEEKRTTRSKSEPEKKARGFKANDPDGLLAGVTSLL